MSNPKQQTDPQHFPVGTVEKLCAAVNEANDAFRAYALAWAVDMKGASYFGVTTNKEIQAAVFKKHKQFGDDGLRALLLASRPAAAGKLQ